MRGIYLVGGYPDRKKFKKSLGAVVASGADFVEVGIPFNDPVADGPVIAKAIIQAADAGISADMVLDDIEESQKKGVSTYLMTYSNIIYSYGVKKFSDRCKGLISGIILADLPNRMHSFFYDLGLTVPIVPFATLESREEDFVKLKSAKSEFIYFVGLRGITGATANFDSKELLEKCNSVKEHTGKKVIIGFGIKTHEDAAKALSIADGFVVGTEAVKRQADEKDLKEYLKRLFNT